MDSAPLVPQQTRMGRLSYWHTQAGAIILEYIHYVLSWLKAHLPWQDTGQESEHKTWDKQDTTKPRIQDMKEIQNIWPIQHWKTYIKYWKLRVGDTNYNCISMFCLSVPFQHSMIFKSWASFMQIPTENYPGIFCLLSIGKDVPLLIPQRGNSNWHRGM